MRWFVGFLLLVLLSGCGERPYDFETDASDVRVIPRGTYAYDGKDVHRAEGTLEVRVHSDHDAGLVRARVVDGVHTYDVAWATFNGSAPYQSGGVARDFIVHGNSGNGGPEWPPFFAYLACWGWATLRDNGEIQNDPSVAQPYFYGYLAIARGKVRDPSTGIVYNVARTGPYDPAQPTDGSVLGTGAQALLQLRTAGNEVWYYVEFDEVHITRL